MGHSNFFHTNSYVNILLFSTITITLALIFYSLGVWAERISRYLCGDDHVNKSLIKIFTDYFDKT